MLGALVVAEAAVLGSSADLWPQQQHEYSLHGIDHRQAVREEGGAYDRYISI